MSKKDMAQTQPDSVEEKDVETGAEQETSPDHAQIAELQKHPLTILYSQSQHGSSVILPSRPFLKSSSRRNAALSVSSSFPFSRQCLLSAMPLSVA